MKEDKERKTLKELGLTVEDIEKAFANKLCPYCNQPLKVSDEESEKLKELKDKIKAEMEEDGESFDDPSSILPEEGDNIFCSYCNNFPMVTGSYPNYGLRVMTKVEERERLSATEEILKFIREEIRGEVHKYDQ